MEESRDVRERFWEICLWRFEKCVRNRVIHGETAMSSFWNRKAEIKASFVCRILEEDGLVAQFGRGCREKIEVKS